MIQRAPLITKKKKERESPFHKLCTGSYFSGFASVPPAPWVENADVYELSRFRSYSLGLDDGEAGKSARRGEFFLEIEPDEPTCR